MNPQDIEKIVRQVLANVDGNSSCKCGSGGCGKHSEIPKTARISMLTGDRKLEVVEVPMPTPKDDEILIRVEGCGICGTDVHEWKGDPFGLIPVVLGHEGTGEIIAMGKNVKFDTQGKPVKVGDRVVTSVMTCGTCPMCIHHPETPNLCDNQGIYGLISDSPEYRLNGWFASHLLVRANSTFFVVNELSFEQKLLLEPSAVAVHAVERANSTGLLNFGSKVVVQGCGPIGLLMIAVLKTAGIYNIIAIDGNEQRLAMAKRMGALKTINFKEHPNLDERVNMVKEGNDLGADFAFQCTGVPAAAADLWQFVRRGGGFCEVGFFVDNGEYTVNPHFAFCNKEVTLVGSWDYGANDYPTTIAFVKRAKENNLPIEDLITHRYGLDELNEAMEMNVSLQGIKIAYVNKD